MSMQSRVPLGPGKFHVVVLVLYSLGFLHLLLVIILLLVVTKVNKQSM